MADTILKLNKVWKTECSKTQFWTAIEIFVTKSHVINRRLIGVEMLGRCLLKNNQHLQDLINEISKNGITDKLNKRFEKEDDLKDINRASCENKVVIVKRNFAKNKSIKPCIEVVVNDYNENRVRFINIGCDNNTVPDFQYAFSFDDGEVKLWLDESVSDSDSSYQWIVTKVVPKLIKWMKSADENKSENTGSLRLIEVSQYCVLYNKLKDTYGKKLVEIWPENTDPLKFVYEDIGIATYLLLLWAGKPKQRFVDLGCGNGLLVYILNSEGHLGVGYDIRPCKIWSLFPPETKLEVRTIVPSSETVFPEADWLIGNHSDELTVWIPVMATRSSHSCNFFVLPCCAYDFAGKKYCRSNTSVSQYSDFLGYVEKICDMCGFSVETDKLRIPSTKRICLIGREKNHPENMWKEVKESVQEFVNKKCAFNNGSEENKSEVPNFKPRAEERVRNCTQISADIRESIVNIVVEQLLAKRRTSDSGWNFGGVVELSALIQAIPSEILKKLKNECGGLQTLLKNHNYIFKVEKGKVEFRVPTEKSKSDLSVWKTKPCWFYHNHPNLCPLPNEKCSFIH